MSRLRPIGVLVGVAALCLGVAVAPAQAARTPGPAQSYLFTVDGSTVKVVPGQGTSAKIVVTKPRAMRWSDRPYRHVLDMSVGALLREFGWSSTSLRLGEPFPNASVSVEGVSHVVEIRRARPSLGRLVLFVGGIDGALPRVDGPGSIVIDNVTPTTQSTSIGAGLWLQATLISPTEVSVVITDSTGFLLTSPLLMTPTTGTVELQNFFVPIQAEVYAIVTATFDPEGVGVSVTGDTTPTSGAEGSQLDGSVYVSTIP